MNKRIYELVKQAGLVPIQTDEHGEPLNSSEALEAFAAFAALVINECCDVLVKQGDEWLEFAKNPHEGYEHQVSGALFAAHRLTSSARSPLPFREVG